MEAVEGPIRLNLCLNGMESCERQSWCPAHPVWEEAQTAMTRVLRQCTINSLAQSVAKPDDVVPLIPGPEWN